MLPCNTDVGIVVTKLICLEEVVHHILLHGNESQLGICYKEGSMINDIVYLLSLPVSECVQRLIMSLDELYPDACVLAREAINIKSITYIETHSQLDDDYIKGIIRNFVLSIMNVESAENQFVSSLWLETLQTTKLVWEEALCFLVQKLNRLFLKRVEDTLHNEIRKRGVAYERKLMDIRLNMHNCVYEKDNENFREYAVSSLVTMLQEDCMTSNHLFVWDVPMIQSIKMAIRAHCRIVSIQLVLEHVGIVFVHPNLLKLTVQEILQNADDTLQKLFKAFRGSKTSSCHETLAAGLVKRLIYDNTKPSDIPIFKYTYSQYLTQLEKRLMHDTSSQVVVEDVIILEPLKKILDHCVALHGQRFLCHMIRETGNDPPTTYSETSPYIRQDSTKDI